MFKPKNKFKPFYKKLIELKENVQNRRKILKFKKQKWYNFITFYSRKLKWYKKYQSLNQNRYLVSKYPNRHSSYSKRYKQMLQSYKKFDLFYGNLGRKKIKNKILKIKKQNLKNKNLAFLRFFEKRLDVILYRAKICYSLRNAQQLVVHGKILVNHIIVKNNSFILNPGDLITVNLKYVKLIQKNITQSEIWPIPPKHLLINYKTMQIIFGDLNYTNLFLLYPFYFNIEKVLTHLYYS